jgi:arginine-tRNA-protein transferase
MSQSLHAMRDAQKPCPYFNDGRTMRLAKLHDMPFPIDFSKPIKMANKEKKFDLLQKGFLSDIFTVFAPQCISCNACVPLRVNTDKFTIGKSHTKLLEKKSFDFELTETIQLDTSQYYELFQAYIKARHGNSSSQMLEWQQKEFNTWLLEFPKAITAYKGDKAAGIALIDLYGQFASGEFNIFDPLHSQASLGTQLWLQTILKMQEQGSNQIYVGAWAKGSRSLGYKDRFKGLETIVDGEWMNFDPTIHTKGPNFHAMLTAEGFNI